MINWLEKFNLIHIIMGTHIAMFGGDIFYHGHVNFTYITVIILCWHILGLNKNK